MKKRTGHSLSSQWLLRTKKRRAIKKSRWILGFTLLLASNLGHPHVRGYDSGSRLNKAQAHKNYSLKWLQIPSTRCLMHCFGGGGLSLTLPLARLTSLTHARICNGGCRLLPNTPTDHENTLSYGRKSRTLVVTRGVYLGVIRKSIFRFLSFLAETAKDLKSITLGLGFVSSNNRCAPLNPPSQSSVL